MRDLDAVSQINFGNVSEHAWQDQGAMLAMVVDAEGMAGNGVQTYDAGSGRISTLDAEGRIGSLKSRKRKLRRLDPHIIKLQERLIHTSHRPSHDYSCRGIDEIVLEHF